jgi:hypothetical protein
VFQAPYEPSSVPVGTPITVPVASIPSGTGSLTPSSNLKPKCGVISYSFNGTAVPTFDIEISVYGYCTVNSSGTPTTPVSTFSRTILFASGPQPPPPASLPGCGCLSLPGSVLFDCDACSVTVKGLQNGSAPTQYTGSISIGILFVPQ